MAALESDRRTPTEGTGTMSTHIAFHEVDDVDHWLNSSKREEVFGPLGITTRAFRDPAGSQRVGLIAEIPDMAAFQEFMQTKVAADAMTAGGVAGRRSSSSTRDSAPRLVSGPAVSRAAERRSNGEPHDARPRAGTAPDDPFVLRPPFLRTTALATSVVVRPGRQPGVTVASGRGTAMLEVATVASGVSWVRGAARLRRSPRRP